MAILANSRAMTPSASWDLAGYRTWPRYFATKHLLKVK